MTLPDHVRRAFALSGDPAILTGGERPVYRCGPVIAKQVVPMSLENPHSLAIMPWLAEHLARLPARGYRLARPLPTVDGAWMLPDGWTAWTWIAGRSATPADVPAALDAVWALHDDLRAVPYHPLFDANTSAWGVAHTHCWESPPAWVHPVIRPFTARLYARLRPLPDQPRQVIHGDLNAANILIAPDQPPGFIDITPFWAPAAFAVAMFANWIGPRQGDGSVLAHFAAVPHFEQLLLRAAIRMLLIVSELGGVDQWSSERRAAEIVLAATE